MILPSIKNLTYLLAVREHLHFAKAAAACYVSQSTLSAGISKLENDLNVQLIERNNKSVLLTSTGRKVAKEAEQVITLCYELVKTSQANFHTSVLTIGIIPTISPYLLPDFIKFIQSNYPQQTTKFLEDTSANLLKRIEKMTIDFAIFAFPYDLPKSINYCPIAKDKLLLVHHQDLDSNNINNHELLLLEQGHCLRSHILDEPQITNMQIADIHCASIATLIAMLDMKLGVSFLPNIAIKQGILNNYPNLIINNKLKTTREIGLLFKKNYPYRKELLLLAKQFNTLMSL